MGSNEGLGGGKTGNFPVRSCPRITCSFVSSVERAPGSQGSLLTSPVVHWKCPPRAPSSQLPRSRFALRVVVVAESSGALGSSPVPSAAAGSAAVTGDIELCAGGANAETEVGDGASRFG